MQLRGTVVKRAYASQSKSAHEAVMLEADDGQRYVLRRAGGNPFVDRVLDELVSSRIEGEGKVHGSTFIMTSWRKLA